mgnify:CR=1 FL=1
MSPVQHEDGHISKVFDNQSKIELTKVERTGDNPVLKESTNLRNGLPLTYQTHMVNDQGVIYQHDAKPSDFVTLLNDIVNTGTEGNINAFRILCGTNR